MNGVVRLSIAVNPEGGVIVTALSLEFTMQTSTSPLTVPVGLVNVTVELLALLVVDAALNAIAILYVRYM